MKLKNKVVLVAVLIIVFITIAEGWSAIFEGIFEMFSIALFLAVCMFIVIGVAFLYEKIHDK